MPAASSTAIWGPGLVQLVERVGQFRLGEARAVPDGGGVRPRLPGNAALLRAGDALPVELRLAGVGKDQDILEPRHRELTPCTRGGLRLPFRDLFSPRARASPRLPRIPAHPTFSSFPKDRERDELEDAERYHPRREPEAPKHLVRRASRRPPFGRPWRFPTAGLRKARPTLPVPSPLGRPSLRTGAGAGRTTIPKAGRATAGLLAASVDRSTVRIIVGAP